VKTPGDFWHAEPAVIVGFVGAFLALLISFGAPITADQKTRILEFATPAYLLIGAFVVRRKVVPVATIEAAGLTPEQVKAAAAGPPSAGVGAPPL
jgi:hypothetical protein